MKFGIILSALFKLRNLAVLIISLGSAYLISGALPGVKAIVFPLSLSVYLAVVFQSLASKEFHEEVTKKQKIRELRNLNFSCWKLTHEAKRYTNQEYSQKMRKVIEDKNQVVGTFFRGEQDFLMEKVAEQTLKLVIYYLRLLINFSIRNKGVNNVDASVIANKMNLNIRKLNFTKDPFAVNEIKKVIEIDEKLINRLKEEKNDVERIKAKLDYMASTVNMFKHQALSSIESEEMLEKLETVVNESYALDNFLEGREKSKIRN